MRAKEELAKLVSLLSDLECGCLLRTVRDVTAGERFWESDVAILYNEHIKSRYLMTAPNAAGLIPSAPGADEGIFAPIPIVKSYQGAERIELSGPKPINRSLTDVVMSRRSRRNYTGAAITKDQVSTLLYHACGATGSMTGYGYNKLPLRSFPSSGGLQAPEVYLSIQAVDGVPAGLYHYHPIDHFLESIKPGNHGQKLSKLALGQPYVHLAAAVCIITAYYERLRWKYGERAYRYACMDCGFLAENLYLAGEGLGLGVCAIAGFVDDPIEQMLGVDGKDEMVLLLVTVGVLSDHEPSSTGSGKAESRPE